MKITAEAIIQMMGGPKQHIEDTMRLYLDKIEEDYADIKVKKRYVCPAKKEGELYQLFAELTLEINGIDNLIWFCLDYMPSSIEIIRPDEFLYKSHDYTNFLNDLLQKLHKVDMALKNVSAENRILKKNGTQLLKNLLTVLLREGPKKVQWLAKNAGVPETHATEFLAAMVKEGKILKDKELYRLA
jgi:hypothetical protein